MSIYLKTFLVFAVAVGFLTAGILILTTRTLMGYFTQQETYRIERLGDRAAARLAAERTSISLGARKWSTQAGEEGRGTANYFLPESLDFALRIRPGSGVESSEFRASLVNGTDFATELEMYAEAVLAGLPGGSFGVVFVGNRPLSVLIEEAPGPEILIAGIHLGADRLENLTIDPNLSVAVVPLTASAGSPELLEAYNRLSRVSSGREVVRSADSIDSITLLRSPENRPAALLIVEASRTLYSEGQQAVRIFLVYLAILGGILVLVFWALLDRSVLSRVRKLHAWVEDARRKGTLPKDLQMPGRDELSALSASIQQLSASLESAQANYRAVVEDQTELICRYDAMLRLEFVNEAFVRYFGTTRSEVQGVEVLQFVHPGDREAVRSRILGATEEVTGGEVVHRVLDTTGSVRWHRRTYRAFFKGGLLAGGQSVSTDVTEQQIAEMELANSEQRYRAIFETAHEGLLVLAQETGRIVTANPAFLTMFGLLHREVLGQHLLGLPPFQGLGDQAATLESVIHGTKRTAELVFPQPNGRLFAEVEANRYRVGDQPMTQLYFRDVTERRSSEEALRTLTTRILKLQDEERRRIARELHDSTAQNLTALQMNIRMLALPANGSGDERARLLHDSREIVETCTREIRTISYLLHPPLLDEVGLVFALRWLADGFQSRTGIETRTELSETIPRLPEELETTFFRVAQEALSNAYKHAGCQHVELRLAVSDAGVLALEVRDDGAGFDTEKMFSETLGAGLGVGLAGMRERLRQLGGQLILRSGPGGTTIRAELLLALHEQ